NQHLCTLLSTLSTLQAQPEYAIHSLPMLAQEEVYHLTHTLNETSVAYDKTACIHTLFEQQAQQQPDKVAVVFADKMLTYKQLNEQSNKVAHYLREHHAIGSDSLVGLCVERSLEMVIGILGILKAGGAYVPLDPSYPQARLNYMLEDAELSVVLTQGDTAQQLGGFTGELVALDDKTLFEHISTDNDENSEVLSRNLAYVIYTSGSTGQPKGVMVEHQALFNRIHWMHNKYGMTADDKVLQKTPYSFDVSVWEFVWTLAYGGQLVVAKPDGHKDPEYLCDLIQSQGITKMHFVPSMLGVILEHNEFKNSGSVKQVFCSGEALQQGHVKAFRDNLPTAELHNLYGPTEAAIDVSYWDCAGDISRGVPIGKAIDNIQLMVLDPHLNVVPQGAIGELHIGGDGLARGYLNQPTLTAERFIDNPYLEAGLPHSSPRLYKTGDLARVREDGEIEYQGRIDHQVKIRGLRIELGEIEHQLGNAPLVDSALVLAKEVAGSMQLIGYVKPTDTRLEDDKGTFVADIKASLGRAVPEHMVPSLIVVVSEWPLTSNGKVDRKALPAVESQSLETEYVAPQTETELGLVEIWSELLG
ncbi:amino acid adenylation domain-containing protein, partial [Pseudoalteromonas sp. MMG005]|uniref:non-ribosomal peptide synthetase n=1 Tax=Pseudoalteromonas sp. MMG005 TaxID=2822682 RepID=UPI001FFDDC94